MADYANSAYVDDEFIAYTTVPLEQGTKDEDILGFWEVSIPMMHYQCGLRFAHHRRMNSGSPHYSQMHSTTCLSRRQQFHVSAFSLRVWKRTQSGAIEFITPLWRPCKFLSSLQSRNNLTLQEAGQQSNLTCRTVIWMTALTFCTNY